ncbi:hypothetical protein J4Q44_G00295100 [Coregonus suidteri]|uniref:Uncharacterized protein n=1 Tax=Coregonus suidteri TaxID=861788 RepID=A0AAN8KV99_9TELE
MSVCLHKTSRQANTVNYLCLMSPWTKNNRTMGSYFFMKSGRRPVEAGGRSYRRMGSLKWLVWNQWNGSQTWFPCV